MISCHRLVGVLVMGLGCLLGAGCGKSNPANVENFGKINTGMSRAEVEKLLGKPVSESKGGMLAAPDDTTLKWGEEKKWIMVVFDKDNNVKMKFGARLDE
jgi:hypothetical protein